MHTTDHRGSRHPSPWGTSRQTERQFGYPGPYRNDRDDDILDRLDELERRLEETREAEYLEAAMRQAGL